MRTEPRVPAHRHLHDEPPVGAQRHAARRRGSPTSRSRRARAGTTRCSSATPTRRPIPARPGSGRSAAAQLRGRAPRVPRRARSARAPDPVDRLAARAGYDVPDDVAPRCTTRSRTPPAAPVAYAAEHSEAAFLTGELLRYVDASRARPGSSTRAYLRPHPPFVAPVPYNTMYDPAAFRRRSGTRLRGRGRGPPARSRARVMIPGLRGPDDEAELRQMQRDLLRDDDRGRRAARPARRRARAARRVDDTLVVLTSDHGEQIGDHWLTEKLGWFDQSYHVPLIVRDPRRESDATRGSRRRGPVHRERRRDADDPRVDRRRRCRCSATARHSSTCCTASRRRVGATRCTGSGTSAIRPVDSRRRCSASASTSARSPCCATNAGSTCTSPACLRSSTTSNAIRTSCVNRATDPAYNATVLEYAQRLLSFRMRNAERTLTGALVTPQGVIEARRPGRRRAVKEDRIPTP